MEYSIWLSQWDGKNPRIEGWVEPEEQLQVLDEEPFRRFTQKYMLETIGYILSHVEMDTEFKIFSREMRQ